MGTSIKNYILILFVFIFGLSSFSQDLIVFHDGSEQKVIIFELFEDVVKYKLWDQTSGQIIEKKTSDVQMIVFENGQKKVFASNKNLTSTAFQEKKVSVKFTVVFEPFELLTNAGSGWNSYKGNLPVGAILSTVNLSSDNSPEKDHYFIDKEIEKKVVQMNGHITKIVNTSSLHKIEHQFTEEVGVGEIKIQVTLANVIGNYKTADFNVSRIQNYSINEIYTKTVNIAKNTKQVSIKIAPRINFQRFNIYQKRQLCQLSCLIDVD